MHEGFSLLFFCLFSNNYLEFTTSSLLEYKLSKRGQRPEINVAFVGWAFQSMSHGSYPDFLLNFFPTRVFFWPPF